MRLLQGIPLLLVVCTLLPGAGALDLCSCTEDGHGAFCSDEPVAPEPSCCSTEEQDQPESAMHAGCSCPVLQLDESTPRVEVEKAVPLAVLPGLARETGSAPPLDSAVLGSPVELEPRPPPVRRHLLLNVFLL